MAWFEEAQRGYESVGFDRDQPFLYHLNGDIGGENSLAASNPEKLSTLAKLLDQWEEEVDSTGLAFEDVPRVRKKK